MPQLLKSASQLHIIILFKISFLMLSPTLALHLPRLTEPGPKHLESPKSGIFSGLQRKRPSRLKGFRFCQSWWPTFWRIQSFCSDVTCQLPVAVNNFTLPKVTENRILTEKGEFWNHYKNIIIWSRATLVVVFFSRANLVGQRHEE